MEIVSLKNIQFNFSEKKRRTLNTTTSIAVIKDLSLTVNENEFCLITGPSGSGKTTLMHIIALMLHQKSGERKIFGKKITKESPLDEIYAIRKKIGYLFQSPYLPSHLTVKEFIEAQALLTGVGMRSARERANEWLEELKIVDLANLLPTSLSGGERQRVALAALLVKDVSLLLLDEPTGNLDEENKEIVWKQITALKNKGFTVITVSHDEHLHSFFESHYLLNYGSLKKQ